MNKTEISDIIIDKLCIIISSFQLVLIFAGTNNVLLVVNFHHDSIIAHNTLSNQTF